jgi:hypothetical protein
MGICSITYAVQEKTPDRNLYNNLKHLTESEQLEKNNAMDEPRYISPITRKDILNLIKEEKDILAKERHDFERDKKINRIQELFKEEYRNTKKPY